MKVEITRNVMINGEPVKAGSFVEVDHILANLLLNSDKARVTKKPEPAPACPPRAAPVNPPKAQSTRRGRAKDSSGED
jgi:hypothetical protein